MKIGMLCYGLNIGGIQRVSLNLANALAEQGQDVFFFFRVDGPLRKELSPRVKAVQYAHGLPRYQSIGTWLSALRLRNLLMDFGIDIVHAHDIVSWAVGTVACRLAKIAIVRTQPNFIRRYERLNARTLRWFPFERWTAGFHAIFNATAQDLICAGVTPSKVFVEPGVLKARYPGKREETRKLLGVTDRVKVVICVGRLVQGKGFEYIPQIASVVAKKVPNVAFWIVGDGPLRPELEDLLLRMKVKDVVTLWGARTDIDEVYEAADVGLFPANTHAGMVEAIAYVPLVAGAGETQNEYVIPGETGVLCSHTDDYIAALLWLLTNDTIHKQYAERARELFQQRFAVETGVLRFLRWYKDVIDGFSEKHHT